MMRQIILCSMLIELLDCTARITTTVTHPCKSDGIKVPGLPPSLDSHLPPAVLLPFGAFLALLDAQFHHSDSCQHTRCNQITVILILSNFISNNLV